MASKPRLPIRLIERAALRNFGRLELSINFPAKKSKIELRRRGGMISVPKIPSLVNGGLVDINTIIGKINYGN